MPNPDDVKAQEPWFTALRGLVDLNREDRVQAVVEDPSLLDYVADALDEIEFLAPGRFHSVGALARARSVRIGSPDPPAWASKAGEEPSWRRAALKLAHDVFLLVHGLADTGEGDES